MKILYVADSSSWHNAKWTEYFAEHHEVHLFSDYKKDYQKVDFSPRVIIHQHAPVVNTKSRHLNKFLSAIDLIKKVNVLMREHNFDIIHSVALYYGYIASYIKTDVAKIYTQQGSELLVRADKNFVYRHMARRVFSTVDCVTGDSEAIQRKGLEYGAKLENNYIIQNGVDLDIFKRKKSITSEKNRIIKIFSPRALDDLYNIDIIIRALAILKYEFSKQIICEFAFGFGVENLPKLKALAENLRVNDNIVWLGYLKHDQIVEKFQSSDVVVSVPSSDSSPRSVYESMACGTVTVISRLPWTNENIEENKHSILVEVRDAMSTAVGILKIINDLDLKASIEDNAELLVAEKFSFRSEMKKMEVIMEELVENF